MFMQERCQHVCLYNLTCAVQYFQRGRNVSRAMFVSFMFSISVFLILFYICTVQSLNKLVMIQVEVMLIAERCVDWWK